MLAPLYIEDLLTIINTSTAQSYVVLGIVSSTTAFQLHYVAFLERTNMLQFFIFIFFKGKRASPSVPVTGIY